MLCDMLALFYGIRCILAYGDPKKTLSYGVLSEFPSASLLYQAKKLYDMIDKVKDVVKDVDITSDEKEQIKKYSKVIPNVYEMIEFIKGLKSRAGMEHQQALQETIDGLKSLQMHWPKYDHWKQETLPDIYAYFDLYKVFARFEEFG